MWLEEISVQNCRSIERATLDKLGRINVLIGRNNAGKSAFFHALFVVAERLAGRQFDWQRTVRNADPKLQLKVDLTFRLSDEDRETFFRRVPIQDGFTDELLASFLASTAIAQASFRFGTPTASPSALHLRETAILASDGKWATIHQIRGEEHLGNPVARVAALEALSVTGSFASAAMALDHGIPEGTYNVSPDEWTSLPTRAKGAFFQPLCADYLKRAFFLAAVRSSADQVAADVQGPLQQTGANLPQALLGVHNNNRRQFAEIEVFVKSALPEAMQLHTPIVRTQTRVAFRLPGVADPIPLSDMGTGVQHLVMIALILATTEQNALFIEEPEASLHPGAQRFLLDQLQQDGRQVFMTTHSPVFLSPGSDGVIFRIDSSSNNTSASRVRDPAGLANALQSIGARNSDMLLSDAVLFVEGDSDKSILFAWSDAVGKPFEARNMTVLPIGSTEAAHRESRTRIEVLQAISTAAPVPCHFLLDRDERSDSEMEGLRKLLGNSLTVLGCREIENCILIPHLIRNRIVDRLTENSSAVPAELSAEEIRTRLGAAATSLKNVVLSKRVRAAMPRLDGGPFPRAFAEELAKEADVADWARRIVSCLKKHHSDWIDESRIAEIVESERARITREWITEESILKNAPSADILQTVFREFGLTYNKQTDGPAIARRMSADEIPSEVRPILDWVPTPVTSGQA